METRTEYTTPAGLNVADVSERLGAAYHDLETALTACHLREVAVNTLRLSLTDERRAILRDYAADPKALGANEAAREARLAELTAPLSEALREAEEQLAEGRHTLEVARLHVERERAALRLLEVQAAACGREH
jgi:hypothetical protein